jgi:NTE family protein
MHEGEYGLVLCGGGGRGAYQIGVWKTLEKLGFKDKITAVSGSSVGALNAAMFATISAGNAEQIWNSITKDDILTITDQVFRGVCEFSFDLMTKPIFMAIDIDKFLNSGLFSRKGLINLIEQNEIHTKVKNSKIACFASCMISDVGFELFDPQYFNLKQYSANEILKILIASSAIPGVFPVENINGRTYRDGGVVDNTPIKPLYDMGYRKIIIAYLEPVTVDKSNFPNAEFIEIVPSNEIYLGKTCFPIFDDGTLDFSSESISKLIELGKKESRRVLEKQTALIR